MTTPDAYELVLTPPAQRAVANKLPEPVAAAVIEFLTTALVANPHRVANSCGTTSPVSGPRAAALTGCSTASTMNSAKSLCYALNAAATLTGLSSKGADAHASDPGRVSRASPRIWWNCSTSASRIAANSAAST